jgi:hypothetical protein
MEEEGEREGKEELPGMWEDNSKPMIMLITSNGKLRNSPTSAK